MLIIALLILQFLYYIKKYKKDKKFMYIMVFSTLLSLLFLVLLHFELISNGTYTYGSDESDFFRTSVIASNLTNFTQWWNFVDADYNTSFVVFGSLILKTTWFNSVFLIRLGNVLLFLNTCVMSFDFAKTFLSKRTKPKNLYEMLFLISSNGIIIWTAIRILKDMMFVYMLIIFLYALFDLIKNKNKRLTNIIKLSLSLYVLQDIRQWFIYFIVLLVTLMIIVHFIKERRYFSLLIVGSIAIMILANYASEGLEILRIYTVSRYSNVTLSRLPMMMGQFMMGPGPIRGLFGDEAFLFTTNTGNLLITFGSLMWWIYVPVFLMALINKQNIKENYIILITLLFYWMTYSYANAGSGDTRVRASFYVLAMLYSLPYLEKRKGKDFYMKYLFLLIPVFIAGIFFSYRTLV